MIRGLGMAARVLRDRVVQRLTGRLPMARLGALAAAALAAALSLPVSASAAVSDHTVSGVSPRGTTINVFDYWIDDREASDQTNPSGWQDEGINAQRTLLFGCGMDKIESLADYNQWTQSAKPYQGIVSSGLGDDGYPVLSSALGGGSLSYLFDSSSFDGKEAYTDVDGLLQVDDEGYYYYNSQENFAEFDEQTNSFTLYDCGGVNAAGSSPDGQFFPFNSGEDVFREVRGSLEPNGTSSTDADINHYFGLSMSTRFVQQDGGYTAPEGTEGRHEVTYNFSGDDDVWIYIDGVLVGDLGGIHNAASVQINFRTGEVLVYRDGDGSGNQANNRYDTGETVYQRTTIRQLFEDAGVGDEYAWSGDTFADGTYHTLDFFYLERGNTDSNMSLRYNLVNIPESGVVKVDQAGEPLAGVRFTLHQADESYQIVEGGMSISAETDGTGEMIFTTENASGQEMPITLEQLQEQGGDYWVLTEDEGQVGYRSAGDMHLRFENGVLLSSNEWDTGAWSQPHVTVTAPTTVREYDNHGRTHATGDGVMFAVVFQRGDDGEWYPVSGDAYAGWSVAEGNALSDVVAAAKADGYQFVLGSGGAYEVTVENLPGDIGTYEYVLENNGGSAEDARYTVRYYWADAESLDGIDDDTEVVRIDASPDARYDGLERVFSVTLNVPNIKNELTLVKTDAETGEPLEKVRFSLYEDADRDGVADSDTALATMETDEDGKADVYSDASAQVLAEGSYVLVESTPDGYVPETDPIRIVVDDEGVHVDAGSADDNVTVETGIGSLVYSMRGFAAGDDVDATLHDVRARAQVADSYEGASTEWEDADAAETHYRYDGQGEPSLAYVRNDGVEGNGDETFVAEAGWSRLDVRQCLDHEDGTYDGLKEDLGERSLNALFTGDVTVRVTNRKIDNDVDYGSRVEIDVSKTLEGRDMEQGEFSVVVDPEDAASASLLGLDGEDDVLEVAMGGASDGEKVVSNILDGSGIVLGDEDAGTYSYTVREEVPQDNPSGGVTYDETVYELTIEVSVGDDGTVSVATSVTDGADYSVEKTVTSADESSAEVEIPFVNEYEATGELGGGSEGIVARKTLVNDDLADGEFSFTVSAQSANGADSRVEATATNGPDGSVVFPAISYTTDSLADDVEAGYAQLGQDADGNSTYTYSYVVAEDTTGFAERGLSTSQSSYVVEAVVTDDGDGTLSVSVAYPEGSEDGLEFVNVYGADAVASIAVGGTKIYETNGLGNAPDIDGAYSFTLSGVDEDGGEAPLPESTSATNVDGSFSFGSIEYGVEDLGGADSRTFTYTVSESGAVDGVDNDASAETGKTFTVTLVDNHDGTISVDEGDLSDAGNQVSFTNSYEADPTTPVELSVTKELDGGVLEDGQFSFELTGADGAPMPEATTATNAADGTVSFGSVTFDEPGEFDYTVTEVNDGQEGIAYDEDPTRSIHVSVTDDGHGSLVAEVSYGEDGSGFVNSVTPADEGDGEEPPDDGSSPSRGGEDGSGTDLGTGEATAEQDSSSGSLPGTGDGSAAGVGVVALAGVAAAAVGLAVRLRRRG